MRYSVVLFIILHLFIVGCSGIRNQETGENEYILAKDDLGRTVPIRIQNQRIVSLTPSITELLFAFTDTTHIVGRSFFCNYPEQAQLKPAVNNYPVDIEAIVRLNPDLVLVKKGMIPMADLEKLRKLTIPVFVQKYDRLSEIVHSVRTLVYITNGDSIKMELWLHNLLDKPENPLKTSQSFIAFASSVPIYVFGQHTFVSELAELIGGKNAIDSTFQASYPMIDVEYILRTNPDKLIFTSDMAQQSFFKSYPVLKNLSAYKKHQLYLIDADVLSRPGSRLPVLKDSIINIFSR